MVRADRKEQRKMGKMKRFIVKKQEASITYLSVFIAVMAVFLLIMLDVHTSVNINRFREVNQIGREYLLRMESDGCLTPEDRDDLETALRGTGYVKNVTISAPVTPAAYGQEITLKIEYDIELKEMNFTDIFHASQAEKTERKMFHQSTTAKH